MIETNKQFDDMIRRSEQIVRSAFPIESSSYVLEATNFRWTDMGPDVMGNIGTQKEHKLREKTLAASLKADLTIRKKGGSVVDRATGFTLLLVPHITSRASYIVDGNEVQTVNQLRLRPGPYTRFTTTDDTETFINAAGGGYRVILSRQTGILRIKSGTTYVYAYPVLKALGITDRQMMDAWGKNVFEVNRKYDDPRQVARLYKSMRRYAEAPKDYAELATVVDSFFRSKALDPEISKITMGEAHDRITPRVLLDASSKAVQLARGEIDIDDTESLAFKSIHAVEDFVPERLEKAVPGVKFVVSRKMERTPKISTIISPNVFTDPVKKWFLTSEFTRYSSQQNPIDMTSTTQLTTTMGEGGIQSDYAVTDQLRVVHPSQMGFIDPMHTPEGHRIGVTGHLTIGVQKIGNRLFIHVINAKTGKMERKSSQELADATIAANDQFDTTVTPPRPVARMVKVKRGNEITLAPAKEVDFIFLPPKSFFSAATDAIPFMHTNSPNRVLMADRHIEQAVPLVDASPPAVQSRFKGELGYDDFFGKNFNIQSPVDGTVTRISKQEIIVRDMGGKSHTVHIHHNYPLNGGSFLTDRPIVRIGDKVSAGQVLAENNFTKGGALALGKTMKVAFIPYKGQNFEDGIVISEGASKKLTSEHQYNYRLEISRNVHVGLQRWLAHFPDKALNIDTSKYDASGVIKKGAVVRKDEVLIPAVEQSIPHEEYDYAVLHKSLKAPWRDVSVTWDSDKDGEVVDVIKTAKFIRVILKTHESAQIGDKLSNRAGGKGIIVNIIPDNEMYQDEQGNVIDILFNPAGMIGRINPGQMFEGVAGKIAAKTGKKYLIDNFGTEAAIDKVEADAKAAGVKDIEDVTDPTTSQVLKDIYVGDIHFMKLQHQVSKKFSARGLGKYTADAQPSKISGESAQNIGSGELYSLLAAGALHFLKDSSTLKSNYNPEYWRALQAGLPTPPPRTPFILDKFTTFLEGAGINLKQEGSMLKALPMTDKDVESRSLGEIKSPGVVRALDLRPEPKGLFDKGVTGGFGGVHWNHIDLETSIPNPLMEKPIISVTGLKPAEYKGIVSGTLFVTPEGELTTDPEAGKPMGEGLKILLAKVDVDRDLRRSISDARAASGNKLNDLNKKRRYLTALKSMKMSPEEAYIQSKVPVIPAKFRPIYPLPDGSLNIADPNHSYREIILINNQLKDLKAKGVDNKNLSRLRADLFAAVQGTVGVTEPLTRSKHFKGFISTIKGRSNKYGLFQGRMIRRPQDLSARSTIIPDPKLGIDEVGVPEEMAFTLYQPFLVRRLVNAGRSPSDALDMVKARDPLAREALAEEAKERPLYLNRAPSLHRFSMIPFKPRITGGKAININPLIVSGFNADFDGDTMGIHVPVSEGARREAMDQLPSKNLFAVRDETLVHLPSKETVLGVYLMTAPKGNKKKAASLPAMMDMFKKNEIKVNTPVVVGGKTWTPGQVLVNDVFPQELRPGNVAVDKNTLYKALFALARKYPKIAGTAIDQLKNYGNHYVTQIGYSIGLQDLKFDRNQRDKIMAEASAKTKRVGFDVAHNQAVAKLGDLIKSQKGNRIVEGSVDSGAFGKADEVRQMIATPVAVVDHRERVIPVPIKRSFAEGHDLMSYWSIIPGSRKGLMQKGLGTQDTGAFSKRLLNTTINEIISIENCKTTNGVAMAIESRDALDRVIADGPYKGKVVDPNLVKTLKGKRITLVKVRSPMYCQAPSGICAKCFGLLQNGQFPPIGYHIGALAGQAISEPMTQLMLRSFHTGGAMGKKMVAFDRVEQIFEMPENLSGKATLAQVSGTVDKIEKGAGGGWIVTIKGVEHFVPLERGLAVRKGSRVLAGQKISTSGVIKSQELLAATNNIDRVRHQMLNDLDTEFSQSGLRIKRKLFETAIKPMTDRAEVTDAGDGEQFHVYKGDITSVNRLNEINREIKRKRGRPIEFKSTLLALNTAPYHSGDFIGQLMFDRPHQTLIAAPGIQAQADLKKGHPVTQYAFGQIGGKKT